jgi:hypothetical protein
VPLDVFGELLSAAFFNREESAVLFSGVDQDFITTALNTRLSLCAAATVLTVGNGSEHVVVGPVSLVLGSRNDGSTFLTSSTFSNGWTDIAQTQPGSLASLSTSTRINVSTGATVSGSHRFIGLPMTGMFARVFQNGTLTCGAGACQGNYGGGFPLRYRRSIQ